MQPDEKRRLFLVARCDPNWTTVYAAALIAASTSARGADLRSLRWSDVDLFERIMTIPDSKSEAGKRRIPLNADAVLAYGILRERASKFGFAGPEFYVFPACENLRIDGTRPQKTWRTAWRKITRSAGLTGLRFHDLRHQMHHRTARGWCTRGRSVEHRWACFKEDDGALQPYPHGRKTQGTRRVVARRRRH